MPDEVPLLAGSAHDEQAESAHDFALEDAMMDRKSRAQTAEVRRGTIFAAVCVELILASWVFFMVTAWYQLRVSGDRVS